MQKNIPAVSIIIPMYNVEKYIGECLESVLAQTFQDYEVIIVDDGSTDNSCAVVESYLPKFNVKGGGGAKARLIRLEKNSGGYVGVPCNTGIRHACGEFFFFLESDDAIIPEAMEIMYTHAKRFNVDVVHCDKCFAAPDDETFTTDESKLEIYLKHEDMDVQQPTFMKGNLLKRVDSLFKMRWEPWSSFIRRDFLMKNNIYVPITSIAQDFGFFIKILFLSKKILLIPETVYVWRQREDSNSRKSWVMSKQIHKRCEDFFLGIELTENFMNEFEIFVDNPEYKLKMFELWMKVCMQKLYPIFEEYSWDEIDPLVRLEIDKVKDKTAVAAFLFSRINILKSRLNQYDNIISKVQEKIEDVNETLQSRRELIQKQTLMIIQLKKQIAELKSRRAIS